jgi:hypothetical protein
MSTRLYDTDLNDSAWAWSPRTLLAARSGGRFLAQWCQEAVKASCGTEDKGGPFGNHREGSDLNFQHCCDDFQFSLEASSPFQCFLKWVGRGAYGRAGRPRAAWRSSSGPIRPMLKVEI